MSEKQFSDEEFERYLEDNPGTSYDELALSIKEKVKAITGMLKAEINALSILPNEEQKLKSLLRDHIPELINEYKTSMVQFDYVILDQLKSDIEEDDDDDNEKDDLGFLGE